MIATTWHGETETLWYVLDEYAEEQPAVLTTISNIEPDIETMALPELLKGIADIERFKWTSTCYSNKQLLKQMDERHNRMWRQARRLEYNVKPLIKDKDRRVMIETMTREQIMRRWPNIVAHVICESLGYATPSHAASILRNALIGDPDYCEWIDACYKGNPTKPVQYAISPSGRRSHHGYMSSFKMARALVQEANDNQREPVFASWF